MPFGGEDTNMQGRRTDLALESKQLAEKGAAELTEESGVRAEEETLCGLSLTAVEILDESGAARLGKPVGRYLTLALPEQWESDRERFSSAVEAAAAALRRLLPEGAREILVVGLGNAAMTPDALGPEALRHLLVTRHLKGGVSFGRFLSVSALTAGVVGSSGIEAAEQTEALSRALHADLVIAIDALAAQSLSRLLSTVQMTDTGIVPGSGVGNHRRALSQTTLGIPVLSLGVPTVVEGRTLALDLLEAAGNTAETALPPDGLFVTPKDADERLHALARLLGYALNLALHGLSPEDSFALLG